MSSVRFEERMLRACAQGLLVGLMLLVHFPATAEVGDPCVTVQVPSPILLPDGSLHPASKLTLCKTKDYSPVASFHKTLVDGMPVCLLISRRGRSEGPARSEPHVFFRRTAAGLLELVGYAWPEGDRMTTYALGGRVPREAEVTRAGGCFVDEDPSVVALVARVE